MQAFSAPPSLSVVPLSPQPQSPSASSYSFWTSLLVKWGVGVGGANLTLEVCDSSWNLLSRLIYSRVPPSEQITYLQENGSDTSVCWSIAQFLSESLRWQRCANYDWQHYTPQGRKLTTARVEQGLQKPLPLHCSWCHHAPGLTWCAKPWSPLFITLHLSRHPMFSFPSLHSWWGLMLNIWLFCFQLMP